ncbi:DoxX family protein [uncultured Hymenobacter sp.]|uniref:DoxX family protein n=1 Tax=uncultured Hymenobacter sp. TaxID=170016 RepID=UPI0035CC46CB
MKKLLFATRPFSSRFADMAWLFFRLHLGLSIAIGAGWAKLVNLTTTQEAAKLAAGTTPLGPPDWFVLQVADLGFTYPTPYLWAWLAAWGEFAGGLLVAVGLLARWSGLQLAFQFLVIAFLWYGEPEVVLGMYYQQLLFWSFVLVTGVGGGRYSLDCWLVQRSGSFLPRVPLSSALKAQTTTVLVFLMVGMAVAQAPTAPTQVTMHELNAIAQQWQGSLTYLDYTTKKPVTLATSLSGRQSSPQELVLNFIYQEPGGGQVKGSDKLQLSPNGTRLVWDGTPLEIHRKTRMPNQSLELVLEGRGQDDNKNCLIRRTLMLGAHQFSVLKEVKYDAAMGFIVRNKYEFHR